MLIKKANLVPLTKNPVCGELIAASVEYAYYLAMLDLTTANPAYLENLLLLKHIADNKPTDSGKQILDKYTSMEYLDLYVHLVHEHDSYYSLINIESGILFRRPEKKLRLDYLFSIKNSKLGVL